MLEDYQSTDEGGRGYIPLHHGVAGRRRKKTQADEFVCLLDIVQTWLNTTSSCCGHGYFCHYSLCRNAYAWWEGGQASFFLARLNIGWPRSKNVIGNESLNNWALSNLRCHRLPWALVIAVQPVAENAAFLANFFFRQAVRGYTASCELVTIQCHSIQCQCYGNIDELSAELRCPTNCCVFPGGIKINTSMDGCGW